MEMGLDDAQAMVEDPDLKDAIQTVGRKLGLLNNDDLRPGQADATAIFKGTKYHQPCHTDSRYSRGIEQFNIVCYMSGNQTDELHLWVVPSVGGQQYAYDTVVKAGQMVLLRGDTIHAEFPSNATRWRWRLLQDISPPTYCLGCATLAMPYHPHPHVLPDVVAFDDTRECKLHGSGEPLVRKRSDMLVMYPDHEYQTQRNEVQTDANAKAKKVRKAVSLDCVLPQNKTNTGRQKRSCQAK
jgi:hypothetical protein